MTLVQRTQQNKNPAHRPFALGEYLYHIQQVEFFTQLSDRCSGDVYLNVSSNAMYQVFFIRQNLVHLVLIIWFRDISTLKQDFHTLIKEINYKTTKRKGYGLPFLFAVFGLIQESPNAKFTLLRVLQLEIWL